MKIIKHHSINQKIWDFERPYALDSMHRILDRLHIRAHNTWTAFGKVMEWALLHWSEHHDRAHFLEHLRLAVYCAEFHYWKALHPGETRTFEWGKWKAEITAPPKGKTPMIHPDYMFEALDTAIILRDKKALNTFLSFKMEDFQNVGLSGDAYGDYWTVAKMAILQGDLDKGAAYYTEAGRLSRPQYIKIEPRDKMQYYAIPHMNIWAALLEEDEEMYNRYFVVAHDRFLKWIQVDENWEWKTSYFLFSHLTAVAAYAHDQGYHLKDFESDYTPKWLIEGDF
jgi:hypothetical protein